MIFDQFDTGRMKKARDDQRGEVTIKSKGGKTYLLERLSPVEILITTMYLLLRARQLGPKLLDNDGSI
jgi:hypothetical protein